ncbi:MAG TPA: AraC family ligand binding domain-containing protein, partial [Castellaniella sp.]|nr:AraC family ligand binding domain-containing protein [Castellaniella sp.]
MKHSPTDTQTGQKGVKAGLRALPRPAYGHVLSQSNMIIPRRHKHSWAQLSYAIQGYLEVWTAQARFIALPQRGIWIPPGVEHRVRSTPHTVIRSLYVDTTALPLHWPDCRVLQIEPLLHELIRAFSIIPIEYDESGAEGRLVQVMLDRLVQAPEAGLVLPWPSDPRLSSICEHLHRH